MKGIQFTIEKTSSQIESILIKSTIKLTPDIFEISFGKFCMQVLYIADTIIKNCQLQKHVPMLFQKLIGKLKQSRNYKPNCQQQQQEPIPIQNDEIYQFMNTRRPIQEANNIAELNWYADRMLKKQKDTTTFMEYMATVKGPNYSDRKIVMKESKSMQTDIVWIHNLITQQEKVLENLLDSIPQFVKKVNSYEQKCQNLQRQIQIQNQKNRQDFDEIKKEDSERKPEKYEQNEDTKKENKNKNGYRNNIKTKSLTTSKRTTFYKQKQFQKGKQKQKYKQKYREKQNKDQDKDKEKDKQTKQIENLKCKIMQNHNLVDLNEQQQEDDDKLRVNDIENLQQRRQQKRIVLQDENVKNKINFLHFNKSREEKRERDEKGQKMGKVDQGSRKENVEYEKEKGRYSMDEKQMKGLESRRQSYVKNRVQRKEKKNRINTNQSVNGKLVDNEPQNNYQKTIEQQCKKNNTSSSSIYPNYNLDRYNQSNNLKNISQFFVNENQMRENHTYDTKQKPSNIIFQDQAENQFEQKEMNRQIYMQNLQKSKKWMNCSSNRNGSSFYEQKINMKTVTNKFATKIKTLLPNIGNDCYETNKENLPNIHMSKQTKMINQKQIESLLSKQEQKLQIRVSSHHERSQKQFLQTIEKGKIIQEEDLVQKDMKIIEKINELQRNQKGNNKKIKVYVQMLEKLHRRICGKECKHLQRYYKQIKNANNWNNRIALNLPTRQIGFFS